MQLLRKASVNYQGESKEMTLSHVTDTKSESATMFEDKNVLVNSANEAWLVELPYKRARDQYFFTTSELATAYFEEKLSEINGIETEVSA